MAKNKSVRSGIAQTDAKEAAVPPVSPDIKSVDASDLMEAMMAQQAAFILEEADAGSKPMSRSGRVAISKISLINMCPEFRDGIVRVSGAHPNQPTWKIFREGETYIIERPSLETVEVPASNVKSACRQREVNE